MRARLGQHSLIGLREALKEKMREGELKHGISKKFEALVIGMSFLIFITNAAMSERELEQRGIAEGVAYDVFQRFHVCLFSSRISGSTP